VFFRAKAQNRSKIAHEIDTKLVVDGLEADLIHQPPEDGDCLFPAHSITPKNRRSSDQERCVIARPPHTDHPGLGPGSIADLNLK
jgi:hypothetical protein